MGGDLDDLKDRVRSVTLVYDMEQDPLDDADGVIENWHVGVIEHRDDPDSPAGESEATIAAVHIVRGLLDHESLWDALDGQEADLEAVGSAVLDLETGDLVDDLEGHLMSIGNRLVILNSVRILDADWRGHGYGALFAGLALQVLASDAQIIATYPAPLDDSRGPERAAAIRKLERVWGTIGFKPYRNGVWIIDPGLVDLDDAVRGLRSRLGLQDAM